MASKPGARGSLPLLSLLRRLAAWGELEPVSRSPETSLLGMTWPPSFSGLPASGPHLSARPDSQLLSCLALSPYLPSDLTPLRSPAASLPEQSWEAVSNVLEGESSAKYKNPLTPWMQKLPRGSVSFPPQPSFPGGPISPLKFICEQQTNKHQRVASAALFHCPAALLKIPEFPSLPRIIQEEASS